ncbi:MAG: glycine cleavage system aminomethyltransferase GcvT [Deltaproteobacteria bacterium]|jgi:aminomethyltransferase|nr:glycine cleavage system aminomethyltransferase GcvT [Deltaproteobacteria bacterium]MBW2534066.1 glycine cleavage system aminomethyltransferase GcvT [Deltaproteobacteria bacterium]
MNTSQDAGELRRTALFDAHRARGAKIVPFAGWEMPLNYPKGILAEHLQTRRSGGLFDVSHMGRFWLTGEGAREFLQHALSHNVDRLRPGRAQYNLIVYPDGGTVDDSYLYMLAEQTYLLVVNAANLDKDFAHLEALRQERAPEAVALVDRTDEVSMVALQGPRADAALEGAMTSLGIVGALPRTGRNNLSVLDFRGKELIISRTGYTGEPVCFEIFVAADQATALWDALLIDEQVVAPIGLGARNTLRSEAGLPLYGDELSQEISGVAGGLHQLAIRVIDKPVGFVGRDQLLEEYLGQRGQRLYRFLLEGRGRSPREGDVVHLDGERIGVVTSATVVPVWVRDEQGRLSDESAMRRVGFALSDRRLRVGLCRGADRRWGDQIEIRRPREGKEDMIIGAAEVVAEFSRLSADRRELVPVYYPPPQEESAETFLANAQALAAGARANHDWRQRDCINLIPSENTPSRFVRWASELDPSGRYAEHQRTGMSDLYYYQGTDWIEEVEQRVIRELRLFFGCNDVEPRPISGQMANETVFESMVRFRTFKRRKEDRRISRLQRVFNNALALGGHLSSQQLGALFNYVRVDESGKACVTHIPLQKDYPYAADADALAELIVAEKPELIIFGKSMVIEPEPIGAARAVVDQLHPEEQPVIMYDMAHVLGLCGPLFQEPFAEGADVVTGSTHKTFFGPQRGVVLSNIDETYGRRRFLWDAMQKAAFPGAVSNHHLGTLQGLLAAAYEFRAFGRQYQQAIHESARSFAKSLADAGLKVEGDPSRGYTQTHQVLLDVGQGKARRIARRLEESNILCNFQGLPGDRTFKISRGLRLGVQEMVRFGMGPDGFAELAQLMADCILKETDVAEPVTALRTKHRSMQYCFQDLEQSLTASRT